MPIEAKNQNQGTRLRLGMVGGGPGAFIDAVHHIAARLEDRYELGRSRSVGGLGASQNAAGRSLARTSRRGRDNNLAHPDSAKCATCIGRFQPVRD